LFVLTAIRVTLAVSLLAFPPAGPRTAQVAPAAPTSAQTLAQAATTLGDSLQQMSATLDRLQHALASLTVSRWKAPGDVRQTTQSDVDSMQRDLNNTLPPLVTQAKANPAQLAPVFSVYRNVDALYDVLLRVSETAQLAGAANDIRVLEEQRAALESSRTQLGTALLQSAQAQDAEVTRLRTAGSPPPAATPAAKTVVDDGPTTRAKASTKKTHKPAATPPPQ
jgi:hypothetical protein